MIHPAKLCSQAERKNRSNIRWRFQKVQTFLKDSYLFNKNLQGLQLWVKNWYRWTGELVRETAIVTVTNVISLTTVNEIAQSKQVGICEEKYIKLLKIHVVVTLKLQHEKFYKILELEGWVQYVYNLHLNLKRTKVTQKAKVRHYSYWNQWKLWWWKICTNSKRGYYVRWRNWFWTELK